MGETVAQTQPQDERPQDKARFVCRGLTVPFILLAVCFAVWGSAANLTDVMVGVFRQRPRIRNAEAPGFESPVLGKGVTHALDSLVVFSFLCGLSVRDVEAALEETFEEQIVSRAPCHGSERTAASATRRGAGVGWSSTWAARASTTASHSLRSCSCC
jgi:hypothetical protein